MKINFLVPICFCLCLSQVSAQVCFRDSTCFIVLKTFDTLYYSESNSFGQTSKFNKNWEEDFVKFSSANSGKSKLEIEKELIDLMKSNLVLTSDSLNSEWFVIGKGINIEMIAFLENCKLNSPIFGKDQVLIKKPGYLVVFSKEDSRLKMNYIRDKKKLKTLKKMAMLDKLLKE